MGRKAPRSENPPKGFRGVRKGEARAVPGYGGQPRGRRAGRRGRSPRRTTNSQSLCMCALRTYGTKGTTLRADAHVPCATWS